MSEGSKDMRGDVLPIAIAASFLRGKGLTPGDPAEFADSDEINQSDAEPASFSVHNFHTDKLMVSIYETEPGRVRIEGLPYDEFIHVLEGRLILTPDADSQSYEFFKGDSLVVPRGYVGDL